MKTRVLLFGAGGHARVVMDVIEQSAECEIVGLVDSIREIGSQLDGYEVLGRQEDVADLCRQYDVRAGLVCIGDNYARAQVVDGIRGRVPDFEFVNAIHPSAVIGKGVLIGAGNVSMAGVVVNAGAVIGNHCIMNTRSSLDHSCVMDDYSSLSPGVTTGGNARIGRCSAVAIGATVLDRVVIGEHTVIGAGALVTKDVPAYTLAYGVPAAPVRKREAGEKYLK